MDAKLMALIGSAEEGSEKAQFNLALVYLHGEEVPLNTFNLGESARWLDLAIAQGSVIAPYIYNTYLGECFQYPRKPLPDAKAAFQAIQAEVNFGNARLHNLLGHLYQHSVGIEKNLSEAVCLYKHSSDEGNPVAHRNLGACYFNAIGVERNRAEALRLFRLAAEQGECGALTALGYCFQVGLPKTTPTDTCELAPNLPEAHRLYKQAAEQGFKLAQNNLAYCYQHGIGCDQNPSIALRLYRLASQHGCQAAHFNLGMCHFDGVDGYLERSPKEAARFFEMAAILGHAAAQNNLGHCYRHGLGVERNLSEAMRLYRLSAEQGYLGGLFNLAFCYRLGLLGVRKDLAEARRLYHLASEQGDEAAATAVRQLDAELKERDSLDQSVSVSAGSGTRPNSLSTPEEIGGRSKSPSPVHSAPVSPIASSGMLLSSNSGLSQSGASAIRPAELSDDDSKPDAKREHVNFALSSGGDRSAARLGLVEKEERYQLRERLGYGAVAAVYAGIALKGKNKSSVFAVKVMQQYNQSYFINELATIKQLSHPNVAAVYESFLHMMDNAGAT